MKKAFEIALEEPRLDRNCLLFICKGQVERTRKIQTILKDTGIIALEEHAVSTWPS